MPDAACPFGVMCEPTAFAAVQTYTYDSLNRIKSHLETADLGGSWSQTFNYDRYGNRKFDESNTSMPTSFTNPPVKTRLSSFAASLSTPSLPKNPTASHKDQRQDLLITISIPFAVFCFRDSIL